MESSRRDLFINMVVHRFIFKNNQITVSHSLTFTPDTGEGPPKTRDSFYCVRLYLSTLAFIATQSIERPQSHGVKRSGVETQSADASVARKRLSNTNPPSTID